MGPREKCLLGDQVCEVPSNDNSADLFTKFLSGDEIDKHMTAMSFEYKAGRDDIALTINALEETAPFEDTKKKRLLRPKAKRWPQKGTPACATWGARYRNSLSVGVSSQRPTGSAPSAKGVADEKDPIGAKRRSRKTPEKEDKGKW